MEQRARSHAMPDRELRRWDALYASGLPTRFLGTTFAGSPLAVTSPELVRRLKDDAASFMFDRECGSWLLWGPTGIGKTGLAAAFLRTALGFDDVDDGWPEQDDVVFMSVPDLFSALRASYNDRRGDRPTEADIIERCSDAGVLILDDLGAERPSEWVRDRLYQIVNRRHGDDRPVIITSNLDPASLGEHVGERTMWRIVEMCGPDHVVRVRGQNLRDVLAPSHPSTAGVETASEGAPRLATAYVGRPTLIAETAS